VKENSIGLISGNGDFPLVFIKQAKKKGLHVYVCAFKNETDKVIEALADDIIWIHLGQIKKIIKFFKSHNVTTAVMLGGISKTRAFFDVRPDILAIKAIAKAKNTHDDHMLRIFARIFEDYGIRVVGSSEIFPEQLASKGLWTRKKISDENLKDIYLGYQTAKSIGALDIGQSVVVSGGTVVAVEAVEGTDQAIRRGGSLTGKGAIIVKVSKPYQDMRFDVTAVGHDTVLSMKDANFSGLAVEAGRTNVLNREKMISLADKCGIFIIGVDNLFFKEHGFDL